jgi:hypothetical protein
VAFAGRTGVESRSALPERVAEIDIVLVRHGTGGTAGGTAEDRTAQDATAGHRAGGGPCAGTDGSPAQATVHPALAASGQQQNHGKRIAKPHGDHSHDGRFCCDIVTNKAVSPRFRRRNRRVRNPNWHLPIKGTSCHGNLQIEVRHMRNIFYIIGLVVVVLVILRLAGLA